MKKGILSKNFLLTMILAILLVVFGVFISIQSQSFLSILLFLFGVVSIVNGIKEFILVSKFSEFKSTRVASIISGITSIVVGVFIIVYPFITKQLVSTIILYLFAFQLIISALSRVLSTLTVKRNKLEGFTLSLIPAAFNVFIALIFILFPTQVTTFFVSIVGIIIIAYGAGLFFWAFRMRKVEKEFVNKEVEGDAEVIE
jgi:uncharacterized membrane protein HdeD (DUF308 family)